MRSRLIWLSVYAILMSTSVACSNGAESAAEATTRIPEGSAQTEPAQVFIDGFRLTFESADGEIGNDIIELTSRFTHRLRWSEASHVIQVRRTQSSDIEALVPDELMGEVIHHLPLLTQEGGFSIGVMQPETGPSPNRRRPPGYASVRLFDTESYVSVRQRALAEHHQISGAEVFHQDNRSFVRLQLNEAAAARISQFAASNGQGQLVLHNQRFAVAIVEFSGSLSGEQLIFEVTGRTNPALIANLATSGPMPANLAIVSQLPFSGIVETRL